MSYLLSSSSTEPATLSVTPTRRATAAHGFSLYENSIHKIILEYPSAWIKRETLNNDDTTVTSFVAPDKMTLSTGDNSESILQKIRETLCHQATTSVILSFTRVSSPLRQVPYTLKDSVNSEIRLLGLSYGENNINVIESSDDKKLGDAIPASKLVYTYLEMLEPRLNKKGMKVISLKENKEIIITYSSGPDDFDRFLPVVDKMIDTFTITESQS
jgi:eukaryotic-like serine/threonine-protein kinase